MLIFQDLIPALNGGMPTWWTWIVYIAILAVGVLFLVKFSDMFVEGTSSIAKKMKISYQWVNVLHNRGVNLLLDMYNQG